MRTFSGKRSTLALAIAGVSNVVVTCSGRLLKIYLMIQRLVNNIRSAEAPAGRRYHGETNKAASAICTVAPFSDSPVTPADALP